MESPESPQYQIMKPTMKLDIPLEEAEIDEDYKSPAMAPDSPAIDLNDVPEEVEEIEEFKGNFSPITPMDLNAPFPESPKEVDLENIYVVPDYLKQPYTEEEIKSKEEQSGGILEVKEITSNTEEKKDDSVSSSTKTFNIN
jgi:hypothetical protein